ncbi:HesB/YadR/YfhF family protein [Erysipelothrix urinaevulpis]|uniref:HesB/YadR/YfhF family protein n=1 Tax=Erysipelothrix urinaevulpis TaxID=2683717 RepID=UPI00135C8DE2|nr:Fe-S cluster assembly protein HesB [Erysipelothrix urinaevulpis]
MKLTITDDAANWFISELDLKKGDHIKFFGKVYGPHDGFSIAMEKVEPSRIFHMTQAQGINFYVEKNDAWFFDNSDLAITFNESIKEPHYELINR